MSEALYSGSDRLADPLITIVIPCRNAADMLPRALESALGQTWRRTEVIVVDDGSVDESVAVAASYGERVRVICKANGGAASARNAGIEAATGEYVQFLDADDYLAPDKVERTVDAIRQHPDGAVFYGDCQLMDYRGHPINLIPARAVVGSVLDALVEKCFIQMSSTIVRKQDLVRAGLFDRTLQVAEDWDLWLRLAASGAMFVHVPGALGYYVKHPGNMSSNYQRTWRSGMVVLDRWAGSDASPGLRAARRRGVINLRRYCAHMLLHSLSRVGMRQWVVTCSRACFDDPVLTVPITRFVWRMLLRVLRDRVLLRRPRTPRMAG